MNKEYLAKCKETRDTYMEEVETLIKINGNLEHIGNDISTIKNLQ